MTSNDSPARPETSLTPEVLPARRRGRTLAAVAAAGVVGSASVAAAVALMVAEAPAPLQLTIAAVEPAPELVVAVAVAPAEPAAVQAPAEVFEVVARTQPWLVLEGRADSAWLAGKPVVATADADDMWVERSVALDASALPARLSQHTGGSVLVVDAQGNRCRASVGAIIGRQFGLNENTPTVGDEVEDWFATAVVAPLAIEAGCGEPLYALSNTGSADAVRVGAASEAPAPLARQARRAFRKLAAYRRIQRAWTADAGGTGRWDEVDGYNEVIHVRLGASELVLVTAYGGSCGGPEGQLVAMWRVTDGVLGERVMGPTDLSLTQIDGVLDVDGDGLPELVIRQDLATATLLSRGGEYTERAGISIDHDFCRC